MRETGTSIANFRAIHRAMLLRSASLPIEAGYPRSEPEPDRASITAGGGGSHGVPMDRSTIPPSNCWAIFWKASSRS
ncbi:MAG: hypothetical protein RLZZ93_1060 [Actinomycetota bacterium]